MNSCGQSESYRYWGSCPITDEGICKTVVDQDIAGVSISMEGPDQQFLMIAPEIDVGFVFQRQKELQDCGDCGPLSM